MKIKVGDFRNAFGSLQKLLTIDLEFKLAYRLRKIAKKIIGEMQDLEEIRIELVKKYSVKDDKGNYNVPPERMEEFNKKYALMLNEEINIEIQRIPYELLEKSGVKFSAIDIKNIEPFMEEPKRLEHPSDKS